MDALLGAARELCEGQQKSEKPPHEFIVVTSLEESYTQLCSPAVRYYCGVVQTQHRAPRQGTHGGVPRGSRIHCDGRGGQGSIKTQKKLCEQWPNAPSLEDNSQPRPSNVILLHSLRQPHRQKAPRNP